MREISDTDTITINNSCFPTQNLPIRPSDANMLYSL